MRKLFPVLCVLCLMTSAAFAGETPAGGGGKVDCAGGRDDGVNQPGPYNSGLEGYSVFPVQPPKRYQNKDKAGNDMPEDTAFAESIRMFLGLSSPKIPDCMRQPRDRGLLRAE